MNKKLHKQEVVSDLAMKSALFPVLVQILLQIILIAPLMIFLEIANASLIVGLLVLPMIIGSFLAAYYAVPKSLFKARKKGQLILKNAAAAYKRRWAFMNIGALIILAIIFVVLDSAGIKPPEIGLVSLWVIACAINYYTITRLLKNGDAELSQALGAQSK